MSTWDPDQYLKFRGRRTQPAIDLVARIDVKSPETIIDLGCGSGNSTAVLNSRWPDSQISGLDSSREMLVRAATEFPGLNWIHADISTWKSPQPVDLIFSNAAFQWLNDLETLLPRLIESLSADGILAFQVPNNKTAPYQRKILQVLKRPQWDVLMQYAKSPIIYKEASFYYDLLAGLSRRLDIWETRYYHIMDSHQDIIEWVSGTGLRPYLETLPTESRRDQFKKELRDEYMTSYPCRDNGKVIFPFTRQFVVAYR